MLDDFEIEQIQDLTGAKQAILRLFNLVEELAAENRQLRQEKQQLWDELNRLKGEQGQPQFKANKKPASQAPGNYSSERERHKPKERKKASKKAALKIDREEVARVDPKRLAADAEFKGYEEVIVQDLKLETDNVRFWKEKYYSPSEQKVYLAPLPAGYEGQFGPGIKATTLVLYYAINTSEPKIKEFFEHVGVSISEGQISNLLIKKQDQFHAEKEKLYQAGLGSSPWQHIDDTGLRVDGVNHHTQIVGNPLYTAYVTTENKDRLAVLEALLNGQPLRFRLDAVTYGWLSQVTLPASALAAIQQWPQAQDLERNTFMALLDEQLPTLGAQHRRYLLEAAALSAYQAQHEFPVVQLLLADDAPQFKRVTEELATCWVHDGRHYKKLNPVLAYHRRKLDEFLVRYWDYYDQLLRYKQQPSPQEAERLTKAFDTLFSETTGYAALDERIAKTKAKKLSLLIVLKHPEIPLHNNPVELEARRRARKRDVSFGPRTPDGKKAWDTFLSLAATTKKLGLSFYQYIHDRVSQTGNIPALAELITQRAQQHPLATSWENP
jgi:hypothetical protein